MFFHILGLQHLYFEHIYNTSLRIDPVKRISVFDLANFSTVAYLSKLTVFRRLFLREENTFCKCVYVYRMSVSCLLYSRSIVNRKTVWCFPEIAKYSPQTVSENIHFRWFSAEIKILKNVENHEIPERTNCDPIIGM